MRPAPLSTPVLAHTLSPLLAAFGFSGARVGLKSAFSTPDALSLAPYGAADLWISGAEGASESVLKALTSVALNHSDWRELQRDRDRLRDVYDRTFEFQSTVLPDGTLIDANETLLAFAAPAASRCWAGRCGTRPGGRGRRRISVLSGTRSGRPPRASSSGSN